MSGDIEISVNDGKGDYKLIFNGESFILRNVDDKQMIIIGLGPAVIIAQNILNLVENFSSSCNGCGDNAQAEG